MRPNIQMSPLLLLIPIVLFACFIVLAVRGLSEDKQGKTRVSDIGKAMPEINLPILNSKKTFTRDAVKGQKILVNFFASWCLPCAAEHEFLTVLHEALAIPIIGVVYKDKDAVITNYLAKHGNPFAYVLLDREGRTAIDWGVTGVPETFLISEEGAILAHTSGPLTVAIWDKYFKPRLIPTTLNNEKAP